MALVLVTINYSDRVTHVENLGDEPKTFTFLAVNALAHTFTPAPLPTKLSIKTEKVPQILNLPILHRHLFYNKLTDPPNSSVVSLLSYINIPFNPATTTSVISSHKPLTILKS